MWVREYIPKTCEENVCIILNKVWIRWMEHNYSTSMNFGCHEFYWKALSQFTMSESKVRLVKTIDDER